MVLSKDIHQRIYFFALLLLAVSLPLSIWLTSFAEVILVVNWLLEGRFREKINTFKSRKSLWIITMLYLIHIVGLIPTTDYVYAFHDLRIKLPVLLLPVIIGTSPPVSVKSLKIVLLVFVLATLMGTLVSSAIFFGIYPYAYNDIREISIFISHIRFSLMIVFSLFILVYFVFSREEDMNFPFYLRLVFCIGIFWFIFFLWILKSITGLVIFGVLGLFLSWIYSGKIEDIAPRFIIRVLVVTLPLIVLSFLTRSAGRFLYREKVDFSLLDSHTSLGNPYFHDTLSHDAENGIYVWLFINEEELMEGWNAMSDYSLEGKDNRGQDLKYTLIRYLTSKGLRKDMHGLSQLNSHDIQAIENGLTNHIFLNKYSLYPRVYEIMWELENYRKGNSPGGHSVAQRLLFAKAGFTIFRQHVFFGTGTGDGPKEFKRFYEENHPELPAKWRLRAHNQYLTFLLTFGIAGFVIAMAALLIPPSMERRWGNYFFVVFFIIAFMSMLNEDTLETQTGVSFFMFFYSLLIFGTERMKINDA